MRMSATPDAIARERRNAFVRWLHRNYYRSAGVGHWLGRRISPIGWCMLAVTGVSTVATVGRPLVPQIQIFSILFLVCGLSLVGAFARRGRVSAQRSLPSYGAVDQTLSYRVEVTNHSSLRLKEAWLIETAPDDRPSFELFTAMREPQEAKRNPFDKLFRFYRWRWLRDRIEQFDDAVSTPLNVGGRSSTAVTVSFTPSHRGELVLADMRLAQPDPLGLFQRCRPVACASSSILILPRWHALKAPILPGVRGGRDGDEGEVSRAGVSNDFLSLREYQPGDPKRSIHWSSWARLGKPVVKEFEDTASPQVGVVLQQEIAAGGDFAFEAAVTACASILQSAHEAHLVAHLALVGETVEIEHWDGHSPLEQMLRLAAVEDSIGEGASEVGLPSEMLRHWSGHIIVTAHLGEMTHRLVDQLSAGGAPVRIIAIRTGTVENAPARYGPAEIDWLDRQMLAEQLNQLSMV